MRVFSRDTQLTNKTVKESQRVVMPRSGGVFFPSGGQGCDWPVGTG